MEAEVRLFLRSTLQSPPRAPAKNLYGHSHASEIAAQTIFASLFDGRVLPFDEKASAFYAEMDAACRAAGRPIGTADTMIATIARVRDAVVVTRNSANLALCGLTPIDPWDAG